MNFNKLVELIANTHDIMRNSSAHAINKHLTVRNWLFGYYIVHYEQNGNDRAKYGEKLLDKLAKRMNIKGLSSRNLKLFRQFFKVYPQIGPAVSDFLRENLIVQSVIAQLPTQPYLTENIKKCIVQSAIAQSDNIAPSTPVDKILNFLSYTHLVQLISINDPLKRTFYEMACIKGSWSVRDLKRQISSLYFERSGMSGKPEKLAEIVQSKINPDRPIHVLKSIYAFEFLGLPIKDAVEESDLEKALLDNLEQFILELGNGFCFEARQKRIVIGSDYYFIDLVFYHRILKCHILLDLKINSFNHENAGQLNTYLNYYKEEIMEPGDNPPIGILLVTDQNHALVHYATANMDRNLFVKKYLVNLPKKEVLEKYINEELKRLSHI